jgi:GTPase
VIIAANKSESEKYRNNLQDFYALGFGQPILISAEHGIGVGDLLDKCAKMLPRDNNKADSDTFRFSIIGRPNVGKSSLVNSILQEERSIVSPIMNTTRDAIDSFFKYHGRGYCIVDTAGIRRKGKVTDSIEIYSVLKAQRSLEKSDAVILVIDCNARPTEQDEVVGGLIQKFSLPAIVLANK